MQNFKRYSMVPQIKLKHYKTYKKKLIKLCSALSIQLISHEEVDESAYIPSKKKILIEGDMSQSEVIGTLLHEIGHVLHDMTGRSIRHTEKEWNAYGFIYTKNVYKEEVMLVLGVEESAWKIGEQVAKMLGIPLGAWYHDLKAQCLDSYREILPEAKEGKRPKVK